MIHFPLGMGHNLVMLVTVISMKQDVFTLCERFNCCVGFVVKKTQNSDSVVNLIVVTFSHDVNL